MARHLGPLELIGDRWVIGDPTRKDGLSIVLTPEGLEQRRRTEAAALLAVEWSRFLELRVRAAYRSWQATAGAGFIGAFEPRADMGRDGCCLYGLVRHPYDLWSVRYTHHERRYGAGHVIVLKALLEQLTEAKALDRLGDPEWLGAVVAKLSSYTSWYAPKGNRLVKETLRSLGT
ncbi:hypothetical protein [Streptomyces viridochromogenes]|uniref:Uncharacterized protein n=1 Tax=Streptomyces viridochromogenes Tue57 TaxID=1160705 RepID=L8P9X3_STRVR|nr:hypothetical protein [Streptomyces viridochromogenes]ELS53210.1 hypothetical protein STVIR_5838 [Streptomyces viridochromogenes Tue57]